MRNKEQPEGLLRKAAKMGRGGAGMRGQATFDAWVQATPRYTRFLYDFRHVVAVVWGVVLLTGIYAGPAAIAQITSDLQVLEGRAQPVFMSESLEAKRQLEAKFPRLAGEKAIIRVHRTDGNFVLSEQTALFVHEIEAAVARFRPEGMLLGVESIYNYWKPTWAIDQPPSFIKQLFLIDGDSSMLLMIYLNMTYTADLDTVVTSVRSMLAVADLHLQSPIRYSSFLGGDLTMRQDLSIAVQADAAFVHSLTLPIAVVLLMLYFRSVKIMLIPLVTVVLSITASLLVMYAVSSVIPLHYLVPALLTCVTLACSVDYCLFFISRLKDEVTWNNVPIREAIDICIQQAPHATASHPKNLGPAPAIHPRQRNSLAAQYKASTSTKF